MSSEDDRPRLLAMRSSAAAAASALDDTALSADPGVPTAIAGLRPCGVCAPDGPASPSSKSFPSSESSLYSYSSSESLIVCVVGKGGGACCGWVRRCGAVRPPAPKRRCDRARAFAWVAARGPSAARMRAHTLRRRRATGGGKQREAGEVARLSARSGAGPGNRTAAATRAGPCCFTAVTAWPLLLPKANGLFRSEANCARA